MVDLEEGGKIMDVLLPRVSALTKEGSPQVTVEDLVPRISKMQPFPRLQAAAKAFGGA